MSVTWSMLSMLLFTSAIVLDFLTKPVSTAIAWPVDGKSHVPAHTGPDPDDILAAFAKTSYFYIGGHYENGTEFGFSNGSLFINQMYVESLEPLEVKQKWPIVMIEGAGQSGTNFLNTPDGRPGWASYFLNQGYHVYIVDQPARGRSPFYPPLESPPNLTTSTTYMCESLWTAPQNAMLWEQASKYTQWPGTTGVQGDPVFDAFFAAEIQYLSNFSYSERLMQPAGLALLERIGSAILMTHSQSGLYGWGIAEVAQPKGLIKGIVALEPNGPPFRDYIPARASGIARPYGLTAIPLTYEPPISSPADFETITIPPPADLNSTLAPCIKQDPSQPNGPRQLPHLQGFPVLVVTTEASYHATYDYCTFQYLNDTGVDVTWMNLPEVGVLGNGHFMFMERNNGAIVNMIGDWLESNVEN